ncbi:MAG: VanZ family protein [Bacteroidota bacterium]|jgi:VanZ family protein|nr:VanZ family protein [Bacteroidia bacterium]HRI40363.1 VanZ family protein [Bacteroidia bacterium]HRS37715.1 VanZ family protein [Bacteroidia bacterium]
MKLKALAPALVWAFIVLVLCGIPGSRLPELSFWQWLRPDKIVHLVLFGTQSYLLLVGFTGIPVTSRWHQQAGWRAVTISILYGALLEWLQAHVFIQRSGDVRDAIANALGAILGWWLFSRFHQRLLRRLRREA